MGKGDGGRLYAECARRAVEMAGTDAGGGANVVKNAGNLEVYLFLRCVELVAVCTVQGLLGACSHTGLVVHWSFTKTRMHPAHRNTHTSPQRDPQRPATPEPRQLAVQVAADRAAQPARLPMARKQRGAAGEDQRVWPHDGKGACLDACVAHARCCTGAACC